MTEVSILDRLPIGVISVCHGAIAFMNYTLRSLFAGAYASLGELAKASTELKLCLETIC